MEREILIAHTKTQKRYKINTDAVTLGDLKQVLNEKGIDYRDMSFTEGISNTQLLDDSSQLPTNLTYKGKTTNNLIIILTNTTKKIQSGAVSAERAGLFSFIKSHNLQDKVIAEFGKNMTRVSTAELRNFAHIYGGGFTEGETMQVPTEPTEEKSGLDSMTDDVLARYGFSDKEPENGDGNYDNDDTPAHLAIDAIEALVKHFSTVGILTGDDFDELYDAVRSAIC